MLAVRHAAVAARGCSSAAAAAASSEAAAAAASTAVTVAACTVTDIDTGAADCAESA